MKKTTILSLAFLLTTIFNYSFAKTAADSLAINKSAHIAMLIINANVTVVLVSNSNATLEVTGDRYLTELITLKRKGDTLTIGSSRNKDLTEAGIIYVPASQLRDIRINSEADVRSLNALQVPKLDVVINGACNFSISNIGELNLMGTESYNVEHSTEMRHVPANFSGKRE